MDIYAAEPTPFNITNLEEKVNDATGARELGGIADIFNNSGGALGLTTLIFFIAGALMLFYLIYGGIMLMTSAADPGRVASAHGTIKNAFIGILIVIFAYWIVQIVGVVLGLGDFRQAF